MLGQSRPQENKTGEHYRLTSEKKRGSYADATGNAAMNTKLSEDRAKGVAAFDNLIWPQRDTHIWPHL
jgi:hypothetical protein